MVLFLKLFTTTASYNTLQTNLFSHPKLKKLSLLIKLTPLLLFQQQMSQQLPSVLPRSRSPLTRFTINSQDESPFRNTTKQPSIKRLEGPEVDSFIQRLQSNRQNLCTCFDIYELLFQNGVPQRCVLHNDFVTLYCKDEHKLLCINCMYESVKHQNRRAVPIKSAFDNIKEDNKANEKRLKQVVESLESMHEKAFNIVSDCKQGLEMALHQLNQEYEIIQKSLAQKYQNIRQSVIHKYSQLSSKYKILEKEMLWLRDTYHKRQINLPKSQQQHAELYEHLLLNTLLDPKKIQFKAIDPLNNELIKNQLLSQMVRIRSFIETGKQKDKKRIF